MIEKIWKRYEKFIAIALFVIFMISLVPIMRLSFFNYAAGDDFSFGEFTRAAWINSHSLLEVIKMMAYKVETIWYSWQGTWFTVALMSLQPEVFSPHGYWITTWILVGVIVGTTSLFMHYLLCTKYQMSKWVYLSINSILLLAMIQFFPNIQSALFWWNGGMHYIIPYGLALIAIYGMFKYCDSNKIKYLVLTSICTMCLGGSSYLAPLAVVIVCVYLFTYKMYCKEYDKKQLWLLCPIVLEMIGLIISMIAPGNKVRGGEEFGFSISLIFETIGCCFKEGLLVIEEYFLLYPAVFLAFAGIAVIAFEGFMAQDMRERRFPVPGVVFVAMFCLHCAMYAPGIYAGVSLSGGIPNTIFQCFLLTTTFSIIYIMGWLAQKVQTVHNGNYKFFSHIPQYMTIIVLVCVVYVIVRYQTLFDSSFYVCHDYIGDGHAAEFKEQMEERHEMLIGSEEREVTLPSIDGHSGPIMHMDINFDTNDWQNRALCRFYDKDVVYKVQREE